MGRKERERKVAQKKPKIGNKLDVKKLSVQESLEEMVKRMLESYNKRKK